jgi:uncharacterized protein involved in exopolysaccharide biosynthesis
VSNTLLFEDLYRGIGREWRLLVAVAVLFLGVALAANYAWPQRYQATAVLTVEPITAIQQGGSSGSVNMDTERVVATSTEVLAIAARDLPGTTVADLSDAVTVSVPKGSQILNFTFTSGSPVGAAESANAIATAYSDQRVANAQRVVTEATDNLATRIDDLSGQLAGLGENSPARSTLAMQMQALQERQATLASATFYSGSLVSPAAAPQDSTKPSITVFLAAGLFLGVLVGAFSALVRARLRSPRTPRTERERLIAASA